MGPYIVLMALVTMQVQVVFAAGSTPPKLAVPAKVTPFALSDVRLLDGPFREAMLRDKAYLLSLDPERLLYNFFINVGLDSSATPYGGWEAPKCELRGHSVGHYLTACSLMYASTGDPALKARVDHIVAQLALCQQSSPKQGYKPGYLSAFPESFIERVEARKPVWAPWYTLHKIYAGLLDAYELCGNAQALEILVQCAAWVKLRVDALSPDQMQKSLEAEFGGMNEVLANLYGVTGNPEHLRLAKAFDHNHIFDPLAQRQDRLDGLHANTQIPKMIGAAREHELTGDSRYHDIAEVFWERVALHRSYVIGGHSDEEHFFPITQFSRHLSPASAETCNTYNMLKLTRHLFEWEPNSEKMDFYERALYNHILASQDPQQGMFVYLMSLKPGHFKTYSRPEDSFWCCVGTGMENHAKYGDSIYFHDASQLYVNLFIASEVVWKEKALTLRQETQFPESSHSRFIVRCQAPVKFALRVRSPAWASTSGKAGMKIRLQGKPMEVRSAPGGYVVIEREWRDGDWLEVDLPLALRVEPLPGDNNTVALLYGPIVLAGELGKDGMPNPYARDQVDLLTVPSPPVPVFVADTQGLLSHTKPVQAQTLTFRTQGIGRPTDVTFIPFYRLHHERYSVYWRLYSSASWKEEEVRLAAVELQRRQRLARTVDSVQPGEDSLETAHHFRGEKSEKGSFSGRHWRHANDGGWFSYQLKVLPQEEMVLVCSYWGGDAGNREFDIFIDGQRIATEKLQNNKPGEFYEVQYPLPTSCTTGKEQVELRFQAHPGKMAGGFYGAAILKPKNGGS